MYPPRPKDENTEENPILSLSLIELEDPEAVTKFEGGRSVAYFCKQKPVRVDGHLIAQLKQAAERAGGKNVRVCLHDAPEALFHDMVILERNDQYYRAHRRPNKEVTYHMIEGSMAALVFDEEGNIDEACVLPREENFIYTVNAGRYRVMVPVSDIVIFHEVSPGPFVGEGDSVFPAWAPDGSNLEDAMAYTAKLLETLNS